VAASADADIATATLISAAPARVRDNAEGVAAAARPTSTASWNSNSFAPGPTSGLCMRLRLFITDGVVFWIQDVHTYSSSCAQCLLSKSKMRRM
jgi:hypothetical protein